ncbi:hypothetical protein TNIN_210771 [Trichonephila inaurata madagascariensis]|uniref:Uncharacterized protein n=1 Tax=Trichonephila inaurata madagascariensis TaxID=2747483 RepID=A0A8X7CPP5_9ARAC|nr:hypothetical protein TNIN_210771 [Trichonephila inaurata madagascariensis]
MECVFECPTHILDRVRSLRGRLKHKGRAKVLETDHLTIRRGKKTILFLLCIVPREIRGPMRGLMDGAVARSRPTFPDVRGQVEDIIWEIERRKTSL